jgi:hypothetical protein
MLPNYSNRQHWSIRFSTPRVSDSMFHRSFSVVRTEMAIFGNRAKGNRDVRENIRLSTEKKRVEFF